MNDSYRQRFEALQELIENAKVQNGPITDYINEQIKILEQSHDEFIVRAKEEGFDVENDLKVIEIEVQQYNAIRNLAQQINLPTIGYDKIIRDLRVKIFGEEGVREYFDNKNL